MDDRYPLFDDQEPDDPWGADGAVTHEDRLRLALSHAWVRLHGLNIAPGQRGVPARMVTRIIDEVAADWAVDTVDEAMIHARLSAALIQRARTV